MTRQIRAVGAAFVVASLAVCRVAHAAAEQATGGTISADNLITVIATYGPAIGGMYLAYQVARALVDRAKRTDAPTTRITAWLRVGRRLAYVTSALGIAGAALQVTLAGSPWTVILATAVAAAFKLLVPVPGDQLPGEDVPRRAEATTQ